MSPAPISLPGIRPVEVVSFIPMVAPQRDSSDNATGSVVALSAELRRPDGLRELRSETVQDGVRIGGIPAWYAGPSPFRVQRVVVGDTHCHFDDGAAVEERESYVPAVIAKQLYGNGRREHRAATDEDQHAAWAADGPDRGSPLTAVEVICLELLRFESYKGLADALLMIHARVGGADLAELSRGLRLVTMKADPQGPEGIAGRAWIAHLARGAGELASEDVAAYHLAFQCPRSPLPTVDAAREAGGWTREEQWLWALSIAHEPGRYETSDRNRKQLESATRRLSGDWQVAIMRRGTAIVTRPIDDPWTVSYNGRCKLHYLGEMALMMTRSMLSDALALGFIKRLTLEGFTARLADLADPVSDADELADLESDFTLFRNTAWREDMGRSHQATLLLRNYDAALNSERLYDRLLADLADYSQKAERVAIQAGNRIAHGTNALIGLVTCFGVPLGALQVFTTGELWVWLAILGYMIALGILPAGEQVIGALLPRALASNVGWKARAAWCAFWIALIALLLILSVIPADLPTRRT